MNILSMPSPVGGHSHLIPLFVLHQRYFKRLAYIQNSFLVNVENAKLLKAGGVNCVDVNYSFNGDMTVQELGGALLEAEKRSYDLLGPSFIVEDNCFTSPLIAERNGVPRISIHRTGFFRSIETPLRKNHHLHSAEKGDQGQKANNLMEFLGGAGQETYRSDPWFLRRYLHARTKIIPGIRSLEILPEGLTNSESYFFSGPLLMKDNPSQVLLKDLDIFFRKNASRKTAFLTLGLVDNTSVSSYIDYLMSRGYAVITTVEHDTTEQDHKTRIFKNRFLPLDIVSSRVDLIIHQCGSGIYHYPILHQKPSITLGTQCYDREDVAMVLQTKRVSAHVPHPGDDEKHFDIFLKCIEKFEKNDLSDPETLAELRQEIVQTMLDFDIDKVVAFTLD
jgi:hypothetical protein